MSPRALRLALLALGFSSSCVVSALNCATKCTHVTDCYGTNAPGVDPSCGDVDCDEDTGTCSFDAFGEAGACDSSYVWCDDNGTPNPALCDKGPTSNAVSLTPSCTVYNNTECRYEWCPETITYRDHYFEDYSCKDRGKTECAIDNDCKDTNGIMGANAPACGTATCDTSTGTCIFDASVASCPGYASCSGTDSDQHEICRLEGNGPSGLTFMASCTGGNNDHCRFAWCPRDAADTSTSSYSCQALGKTQCTQDSDCVDEAGETGAKDACGDVECITSTGTCKINAWVETAECADTFNWCDVNSALCMSEVPTFLTASPGSCTGWRMQECEYAWCPGDLAPDPLTSISLSIPNSDPVKVGDNRKIEASGVGRAILPGEVTWTSSDPAVADFTFPGLLTALAPGTVTITAAVGAVDQTATVTVVAAGQNDVESCDVREVGMKVLVVTRPDILEVGVPAIRRTLGYMGVPYDEVIIDDMWTEVSLRSAPCRGNYQAAIVSDGGLVWWGGNGLKDKDGLNLWSYQDLFGVRVVYWYAYPSSTFGYTGYPQDANGADIADADSEPLDITLTADGQAIFPYLTTTTINFLYAWKYYNTPLSDGTKPLLVDSEGNSFATIYNPPGTEREMLTITANSNEYLRHIHLLGYGIVNWVTKGVFLGNRRIYVTAHNDDYLIADDTWTPETPCGTPTDQTGSSWRMGAVDLEATIAYQNRLKTDDQTKNFVFDMVYNGIGANRTLLIYQPDTLTPKANETEDEFRHINHGYDHLNLDFISRADADREIQDNQNMARCGADKLCLTKYTDLNMVTAQVSGMKNQDFLDSAYANGIRYLVSDTSREGELPLDNRGLYNWLKPQIFMIPRRPNELYYNVDLPESWVAEYNCLYNTTWGILQDFSFIVDYEAEKLVTYMISGERYPWMFHQSNFRLYSDPPRISNQAFLLEELLEATFAKFKALYNLPIVSPAMHDLGGEVQSHMEIDTVTATLAPGIGMIIESTMNTKTPVTGTAANVEGADCMVYGGQNQCYVNLVMGQQKFVPV